MGSVNSRVLNALGYTNDQPRQEARPYADNALRLLDLPTDMLRDILQQVPTSGQAAMAATCKTLRQVVRTSPALALHQSGRIVGIESMEPRQIVRAVGAYPGGPDYLRHLNLKACKLSALEIETLSRQVAPLTPRLESLSLQGCENLTTLPELDSLMSLRRLNLTSCRELAQVDGLSRLTRLTWLSVARCIDLRDLPGLGQLVELRHLDFSRTYSLKAVEGLTRLQQLACLIEPPLSSSAAGNQFEQLRAFSALTELHLDDTFSDRNLQGLRANVRLRNLRLLSCPNLSSTAGIESLTELQQIYMDGCRNLTSLSGLSRLPRLASVEMHYMPCVSYSETATLPSTVAVCEDDKYSFRVRSAAPGLRAAYP